MFSLRTSQLQICLIGRHYSQVSRILATRRFKSTDGKDGKTLESEKLKAELEELTKHLDDDLKERPNEMQKELDKNFMNFRKMQEVNVWRGLKESLEQFEVKEKIGSLLWVVWLKF